MLNWLTIKRCLFCTNIYELTFFVNDFDVCGFHNTRGPYESTSSASFRVSFTCYYFSGAVRCECDPSFTWKCFASDVGPVDPKHRQTGLWEKCGGVNIGPRGRTKKWTPARLQYQVSMLLDDLSNNGALTAHCSERATAGRKAYEIAILMTTAPWMS